VTVPIEYSLSQRMRNLEKDQYYERHKLTLELNKLNMNSVITYSNEFEVNRKR